MDPTGGGAQDIRKPNTGTDPPKGENVNYHKNGRNGPQEPPTGGTTKDGKAGEPRNHSKGQLGKGAVQTKMDRPNGRLAILGQRQIGTDNKQVYKPGNKNQGNGMRSTQRTGLSYQTGPDNDPGPTRAGCYYTCGKTQQGNAQKTRKEISKKGAMRIDTEREGESRGEKMGRRKHGLNMRLNEHGSTTKRTTIRNA